MEKRKELETALEIAIVFVAITSIFSLLIRIITCAVTGVSD